MRRAEPSDLVFSGFSRQDSDCLSEHSFLDLLLAMRSQNGYQGIFFCPGTAQWGKSAIVCEELNQEEAFHQRAKVMNEPTNRPKSIKEANEPSRGPNTDPVPELPFPQIELGSSDDEFTQRRPENWDFMVAMTPYQGYTPVRFTSLIPQPPPPPPTAQTSQLPSAPCFQFPHVVPLLPPHTEQRPVTRNTQRVRNAPPPPAIITNPAAPPQKVQLPHLVVAPSVATNQPDVFIAPPAPQQSEREQDYLCQATRNMCQFCEEHRDFTQTITYLSNQFLISRRRFYDVINIMESMGVCQKVGIDSIYWRGLSNVKATLTDLRREMGIDNPEKTLDDLFTAEKLIGIGRTNAHLLMLFPALRVKRINLKKAAELLAHGVVKYRTMLGKLFQIAYIVRSVGVVKRTALNCEIELRDDLCDFPVYPEVPLDDPEPVPDSVMPLSELLNRPPPNQVPPWVLERRRRFEQCPIFTMTAW